MRILLLTLLLVGTTAYGQRKTSIKQIDSIVTAINKMPLAVKGDVQEFGPMKNSTQFYYDSIQNTLHKVVQYFGSEEGSMELVFYYSNHMLQKCMFTTKELKKEPFVGYIYYEGENVLSTNTEEIDFKTNRWRGQSFVEAFQKQ
jgi:hypothetical protein